MEATGENIRIIADEMADFYMAQGLACVSCGGACEAAGGFIPFDQDAHGAPEGKTRMFFYPICFECYVDEEKQLVIEAQILKHFVTEH